MVSLLLPVIYLAFISLGLPDALLGAACAFWVHRVLRKCRERQGRESGASVA